MCGGQVPAVPAETPKNSWWWITGSHQPPPHLEVLFFKGHNRAGCQHDHQKQAHQLPPVRSSPPHGGGGGCRSCCCCDVPRDRCSAGGARLCCGGWLALWVGVVTGSAANTSISLLGCRTHHCCWDHIKSKCYTIDQQQGCTNGKTVLPVCACLPLKLCGVSLSVATSCLT